MKYRVRHLERLTVMADGKAHCGYNQDWYPERWQRLAGCGPTTGAVILSYIEGARTGQWPQTVEAAREKMLAFWPYATPRMHGLYKVRWLMEGLNACLADRAMAGKADMLNIPILRPFRPTAEEAARFIRQGLLEDAPLGFLDLHNGGDAAICSWHWMPLVGLDDEGGRYTAEVLDEGRRITFDFTRWLKASAFGGGLVRVVGSELRTEN